MKYHIKVYADGGAKIDELKTADALLDAMAQLSEQSTKVISVEAEFVYIKDGCLILEGRSGKIKMALASKCWIGMTSSE